QFSFALLVMVGLAVPVVSADPDTASGLRTGSQCTAGEKCIPDPKDPLLSKTKDCTKAGEDCNVVAKYLNPAINLMAILAGVAVTIGIITGGIQYASSGGDPQKAAEGKKHIKMAVVALVGFIFLYMFLQFLIPGSGLTR
ncbi:MAG TPA: pilin, partial [Candidatus Saccharimonadales bacterium]|nr:pilin [Candidatus Saccharimonadales bacterium]